MRLYTFLLLIQIATVLSLRDCRMRKADCKRVKQYEGQYGQFQCPSEKGNFSGTGSGSYEEIVEGYFKGYYRMRTSPDLKGVACAANRKKPIEDGCGFSKFHVIAKGDRKLWLPGLIAEIQRKLKECAIEIDGNVPFDMNCDGMGIEVTCVAKYKPNNRGKGRKHRHNKADTSRKTQPREKGSQNPVSPAEEKLPSPAAPVEKVLIIGSPKMENVDRREEGEGQVDHSGSPGGSHEGGADEPGPHVDKASQEGQVPSPGQVPDTPHMKEAGPDPTTQQENGSHPSDPVGSLENVPT